MALSPSDILKARGIYEEAIRAGWVEQTLEPYWHYAIYSLSGEVIATRAKAYPGTIEAKEKKNKWIPSKPANPETDYYILPGTKEAIEKANGIAFLANGEASVLAMHAAGMKNSFTTCHGESTVPKTLISTLQALGVTTLINIADNDKAGLKAAVKWRDALLNSGVEYIAKQWPLNMPEKGDFNDLWILLGYDANEAQKIVNNRPLLILPQPEVKRPTLIPDNPEHTPQGLIDTIASSLGLIHFAADGFSRNNVHCLFHEDSHSSAGFNRISGVLNCFACGSHSPKEVAEKLGIDWKQYYPERPKKARKTAPKRESLPAPIEVPIYVNTAWVEQDELPLSWAKAFLHLTHSKSATTVYAIRFHRAIRQGLLDGKDMTIKQIMAVLGSARISTQSFIDFMHSLNFLWILDTKYLSTLEATEGINKSKGRPEIHYALNTHTDSLSIALAERLEPVLIERLSEHLNIAPRAHTMRDALDLDLTEGKLWAERVNTPKHEYILKLVSDWICDVLENKSTISFTDYDLEHPQNLRGKLLTMKLEPYSEALITASNGETIKRERTGVQISRAELSLELGCSESALDKLYAEYHVGRKRMYDWYQVENPNFCDIEKELREAPSKISKEVSGVAYTAYIRYWNYGKLEKTGLLYAGDILEAYQKYNGKIEALYIRVEQPSLLWNMTLVEIEESAKKASKEAESAISENEPGESLAAHESVRKAEKKETRRSFVSKRDRLTTGHNPDFLRKEIEKEVAEFDAWELKGLGVYTLSSGEMLESFHSLREVVIWLNHQERRNIMPKAKNAVYFIHCEFLNKSYIGVSSDAKKSVNEDFAMLKDKKHPCRALQAAYNEFGKSAMSWGVVEELKDDLLEENQYYWIQKLTEHGEKPFAVFNPIAS